MCIRDRYTFRPDRERSFPVTGIIQEEDRTAFGLWQAYSYLDVSALGANDSFDITVKVNRLNRSIYADSESLGRNIAQNGITYNDELLRYSGIINDDYLLNTFTILTVIVGTIVMAGSILLSYNAFAISIAERNRQLGMLSSVGATRKQKRNSVFFEAVLIGAVAIPLGIIFGILGIGITFRLISPLIPVSYTHLFVNGETTFVHVHPPSLENFNTGLPGNAGQDASLQGGRDNLIVKDKENIHRADFLDIFPFHPIQPEYLLKAGRILLRFQRGRVIAAGFSKAHAAADCPDIFRFHIYFYRRKAVFIIHARRRKNDQE